KIPPTADKLRRIFGLAQVTQSHALSLFYLSSPDLLLGMDADPAKSNIFGVAEKNPELALDGIRLRQFGQKIIERLGGKRIHPAWIVPGGVSEPLTEANRDAILWAIPDALAIAERTAPIKSLPNFMNCNAPPCSVRSTTITRAWWRFCIASSAWSSC